MDGLRSQTAFRRLRRLGAVASVTALALSATACAGDAESGDEPQAPSTEVVYAGFGGVYEELLTEAVFDPFEEETGITVRKATGAENISTLRAMVDAGNVEWDVVDLPAQILGMQSAGGYLEEIDPADFADVDFADTSFLAGTGVGYYTYSHNLYWNTDLIDGELSSWEDVWDVEAHPGTRGFLGSPGFLLEEAIMSAGVPVDEVYPLDVDLAFEQLDKIRDSAAFQATNELATRINQQDVVTGGFNLARLQSAIESGVPLAYSWDQAVIDVVYLGIPKGAKNRDAAIKLMQFALQPEQQLKISELLGYSPVTDEAFGELPEGDLADMAGSPETIGNSVVIDPTWWGENGDDVNRRFQEWLVG